MQCVDDAFEGGQDTGCTSTDPICRVDPSGNPLQNQCVPVSLCFLHLGPTDWAVFINEAHAPDGVAALPLQLLPWRHRQVPKRTTRLTDHPALALSAVPELHCW